MIKFSFITHFYKNDAYKYYVDYVDRKYEEIINNSKKWDAYKIWDYKKYITLLTNKVILYKIKMYSILLILEGGLCD